MGASESAPMGALGSAPLPPLEAPTQDRFENMLLGMAIGDAVGASVEGNSPDACRHQLRLIADALRQAPDGSTLHAFDGHFPFGQITDDTQLAREVILGAKDSWDAHQAVEAPAATSAWTLDAAFVAQRFAAMYKAHAMVHELANHDLVHVSY